MGWAILAVVAGLALLIWSADRFVTGAALVARHLGMPSLLIGMVVVGFGTSAPELVVSVLAASQGNAGIALGNAYGSNITNIALILGLTAVICPMIVQSRILKLELPILAGATALAAWQLRDGMITRPEAAGLMVAFAAYMAWAIWLGMKSRNDALAGESERELAAHPMSFRVALVWLVVGLVMLVVSSRILVWGAVHIARSLGVSDLMIGLTVVAMGTSLPELASSIIAARRGEHDIAIGNVIGSNMFNTLAVVGLAGLIQPMSFGPELLHRDMLVMALLTGMLYVMSIGWKKAGRINRLEGAILLICYVGYTAWLVKSGFLGA